MTITAKRLRDYCSTGVNCYPECELRGYCDKVERSRELHNSQVFITRIPEKWTDEEVELVESSGVLCFP